MSTGAALKQHKPGVWTEAEDALLALWQGRVGNKWSEVAKHIPGKTGQQCAQRWRHRVNPNISREKWSDDEDRTLVALVAKYGNSWAEIARRLPGRTDQQCMGRWRRHLDPSIKRDGWEPEEDQQLRELYAEYGSSWSCISKSMTGRTAQQCRARWCQLTNAERPSRSTASRSKASSTQAKPAGAAGHLADLQQLQEQHLANLRRQSTANTSHLLGMAAAAAAAAAADPAALFAAAAAEGAAVAAAAAAVVSAQAQAQAAAEQHPRLQPAGAAQRARRQCTVAQGGGEGGSGAWSPGTEDDEEEESEEEEEEDDSSPEFTLRRTTARTSRGARTAAAGSSGSAATAARPLPSSQQHHALQPPAAVAAGQQQASLPSAGAAQPRTLLPEALLPLRLDLPAAAKPPSEEEDSPALTQNPAQHAATSAVLSPLQAQLPPAPPLFTPSRSGRKRSAASRMAAFGPSLPPLVIPDSATAAATAAKGTPVRPTPGSGPMSLELPSPNVLTLLQSPPPLMEDLFRSPGFGSMLTPPWAKSGSSGSKIAAMSGGGGGASAGGGDDDDRRQSVARRLDTAPSFSPMLAEGDTSSAAAAAAQQQQQQHGGVHPASSFDFGVVLGSPPKKSKTTSPGASQATMATAGTPWMPHSAAALAASALVQLPADSVGGGTTLAMAVQQHLLLASTAKAGPATGAVAEKENGEAARQATLTAAKPAAAGSPAKELTSSNVRMRLHALLETM